MPPDTQTVTLLDLAHLLLKRDKRSCAEIARATGLNYFWLRKMRLGTIKNPGVRTVEKLVKLIEAC